ncbi:MAG: CPBP family intramembrane metalloprotease [Bacteroidetes bacterium]|nr:CPBP family intramembrane metalloprotease [Bacteroidota bacterium]
MTEPVAKKALIPFGWLRTLLFFIFYFVILFLISILVSFIIVFLKKDELQKGAAPDIVALLKGEYLWLTTVIALIASWLVVFLFRKIIDRKSFASLGFERQGYASDAISGFFLALTILGAGSLILFASGHLQWVDIDPDINHLFISAGILMMVAFSEEIVFRGYILNNLMESFNKWVALLVSALLFAAMHFANDSYNFFAFINVLLAGVLLGINYIYTKNLWFAIFFHFAWNFFEGPVLGYKVSGLSLPSILQPELHGDEMITGGSFGFEGSIIGIALLLFAIFIVYFVYEKKFRPSDVGDQLSVVEA